MMGILNDFSKRRAQTLHDYDPEFSEDVESWFEYYMDPPPGMAAYVRRHAIVAPTLYRGIKLSINGHLHEQLERIEEQGYGIDSEYGSIAAFSESVKIAKEFANMWGDGFGIVLEIHGAIGIRLADHFDMSGHQTAQKEHEWLVADYRGQQQSISRIEDMPGEFYYVVVRH